MIYFSKSMVAVLKKDFRRHRAILKWGVSETRISKEFQGLVKIIK